MGQFVFGSGSVLAIPASSSATPTQFGTLQDVSIDFAFTNKELTGQYQFPVAVGRGPAKVTGKAKAASFSANFFNQAFFGITPSAGQTETQLNEAHSVPASTPYTVVIAPPGSGTFLDDGGVVYATGALLQRVATPTVAGEYSVNTSTGTYTFYSGDASAAVLITYTYTVAAVGYSAVLANQLMGSAPIFKMVLTNTYNSNQLTLELYQVMSDKLSMGFKNTDWSVPEFDFSAFTNAANNLGKLSLTTL
jgi:hypothetical protein